MRFVAIIAAAILVGCHPPRATYDHGRDDDYAVGYNTACDMGNDDHC